MSGVTTSLLFLITSLLAFCVSATAAPDGLFLGKYIYNVQVRTFRDQGEFYRVFVLSPSHAALPVIEGKEQLYHMDLAELGLARYVAALSKEFIIRELRGWYPDIDASFFDEMAAKLELLDGRSTTIAVFDRKGAAATFRVAWPTPENSLIPDEEAFEGRAIELESEAVPREEYPSQPNGGKARFEVRNIKNIVFRRDLPPRVRAMVIYATRKFGLTGSRLDWEKTRRENGFPVSRIVEWLPFKFVVYCDERMVEHWQRLGFKRSRSTDKGHAVRMWQSFQEFETTFFTAYLERGGGEVELKGGPQALPDVIWEQPSYTAEGLIERYFGDCGVLGYGVRLHIPDPFNPNKPLRELIPM